MLAGLDRDGLVVMLTGLDRDGLTTTSGYNNRYHLKNIFIHSYDHHHQSNRYRQIRRKHDRLTRKGGRISTLLIEVLNISYHSDCQEAERSGFIPYSNQKYYLLVMLLITKHDKRLKVPMVIIGVDDRHQPLRDGYWWWLLTIREGEYIMICHDGEPHSFSAKEDASTNGKIDCRALYFWKINISRSRSRRRWRRVQKPDQ